MRRVTLGDVAWEVKNTFQGDRANVPIVGLEHLDPEEIRLTRWDSNSENTFSKEFKKGHILFGRRRSYLKKAAIAPFDGICSGDITVIAAQEGKVLPELLPFIIQNDRLFAYAEKGSAGSLSPRVKWEYLKCYEFDLPPIEEQKKLAELLWAAYGLKESYKKLLSASDEMAKSRFIEMFGDIPVKEHLTIAELCEIITDGTHQPPPFTSSGIPFLFVSNIVNDKITYNAEKFISEETYGELIKRTPVAIGDLLLSTVGSYGHAAVVDSARKFCFQRHIAYLKPYKNIVDSRYLHSAILSAVVQEQIEARVRGIAQKTLNLSEIRKIRLPLPPISLQNKFASFIEELDKSKIELQDTIAKLARVMKSLLP